MRLFIGGRVVANVKRQCGQSVVKSSNRPLYRALVVLNTTPDRHIQESHMQVALYLFKQLLVPEYTVRTPYSTVSLTLELSSSGSYISTTYSVSFTAPS